MKLGIYLISFPVLHDKWIRHHGMAHPLVANGGMASNMEGTCKYNE